MQLTPTLATLFITPSQKLWRFNTSLFVCQYGLVCVSIRACLCVNTSLSVCQDEHVCVSIRACLCVNTSLSVCQYELVGAHGPASNVRSAPSSLPAPTSSSAHPQATRPPCRRAVTAAPRAGPAQELTLDTRISTPFRFQLCFPMCVS